MEFKKDGEYCSFFPERWIKGFSKEVVDIRECCFMHDFTEECSTRKFYLCLKDKIGRFHATYIAFGGSIGCWVKHTRKMIKALKIKYNNRNN